ncbi:MAG: bifunctional glutamate N-acetyltransferase/amino-acid acetyltransferase ArgJ [Chthoniobacterales bacterium]
MSKRGKIKGGVCAAKGFVAGAVHVGVKAANKDRVDLAVVAAECAAVAAATFTTNRVQAAPVLISKEHVASKACRAVILNSGNANACTGDDGLADARAMATETAVALGVRPEEVLVCSTGRIGVPMPIKKIRAAIPGLVESLDGSSGRDAAVAIMTSDSVPKEFALEVTAGRKTFRIGGMAKGAGMIDPNMATMLSVITTDAELTKAEAKRMLKLAVGRSFNRITVDGDMSTNDTVILLCSGVAGRVDLGAVQDSLDAVALDLATKIVLDGEGVSRFVEVAVAGAASVKDARKAAEAVANSQLVKCAWAGADPNWGRILDAVGYSGAKFDPNRAEIDYDDVSAVRDGMPMKAAVAKLRRVARKKAFKVTVRLNAGDASYSVLTTDLTEAYVHFNLGE